MKKSNLRYLGFLGVIGLLGLVTDNYGFFGFFGFFSFWCFAGMKNDELLRKNISRAGLNAFVVSFIGISLAIATLSIIQTLAAAALFIGGIFLAQIFTFIISLIVYERQGG